MSERDGSNNGDLRGEADRTLLGVPAPRIETTSDSGPRSPVFVRSGTSIADVEPPPLPRMALPSRPVRATESERPGPSVAPQAVSLRPGALTWSEVVSRVRGEIARTDMPLWMVLWAALLAGTVFVALVAVLVGAGRSPAPKASASSGIAQIAASPAAPVNSVASAKAADERPSVSALADLAAKSPDSLSAGEVVLLAEGRSRKNRELASSLRSKLEGAPALVKDKAVQAELLQLVANPETARDGLAALAASDAPIGPDLLYDVWTGTPTRNDTTELARALLYSKDVRPKASAPLSVALDLRSAESCEQYRAILPNALKDGDRRSLHLLIKLTAKRGCGAKKSEDCYACLRERPEELTATINAVKSRRPPSYVAP